MEYFVFERDFVEDGIRCIPMVVRLKLDTVGIKLKLAHWARFGEEDRARLASMACDSIPERDEYRGYLEKLIARHMDGQPTFLPADSHPAWFDRQVVPEAVNCKAAEFGWSFTSGRWSALTVLQRFALIKLCRPGHENRNFPKAMVEFGLTTPTAELIVVGAGPGDPELITLKAVNALRRAQVVMYDNLINKALLAHAPAHCERIYVGKQPYGEYTPQEEIHRLIRAKAMEKGCVVRLKGGDPFIFGRGMEEILFAREQGIPGSYIPGITSMQALGLEGIPLTHRGLSESVWLVTGTKKDGSLSEDLALAMQSKATVVIYMGMKKLAMIANTYVEKGRGDWPAAIVQHASMENRRKIVGLVKDLPFLAAEAGLHHPALIVIGDVVGLIS